METTKKELISSLKEIREEIKSFRQEIQSEIKKLETERYWPLVHEANRIKKEITECSNAKYKYDLDILFAKEKEINKAIDTIAIQEANNIWHPPGTIVTLWECRKYDRSFIKTDKTGTVAIYDGTQDMPENMQSYSLPKKGDVVVFHNKKDGTIGKRFDIISKHGQLLNYFPKWLADGETPTDNIITRSENEE